MTLENSFFTAEVAEVTEENHGFERRARQPGGRAVRHAGFPDAWPFSVSSASSAVRHFP